MVDFVCPRSESIDMARTPFESCMYHYAVASIGVLALSSTSAVERTSTVPFVLVES